MAKATVSTTSGETVSASGGPDPIVIDLGKQKRKRIRRLRRGRGRLMARVMEAHAHLKSTGVVDESAQPLVVVVRQKRKRRGLW